MLLIYQSSMVFGLNYSYFYFIILIILIIYNIIILNYGFGGEYNRFGKKHILVGNVFFEILAENTLLRENTILQNSIITVLAEKCVFTVLEGKSVLTRKRILRENTFWRFYEEHVLVVLRGTCFGGFVRERVTFLASKHVMGRKYVFCDFGGKNIFYGFAGKHVLGETHVFVVMARKHFLRIW